MKFYKKRWIQSGIILISSLGIVLSVFPSFADDNIDNLKGQTSALESELDGINKDILSLSEEISATEMQVEILNGEIARTSDALVEAEENENEQYENMKSRIKYMYEHGNATLLEMLFSAENMADFINKADFIENLSEYDKTALDDLKNIYKNIEDQKNTLETQQDSLLDLKDELKKKQTELQEKAKATSTNLTEVQAKLEKAKAEEAARLEAERLEQLQQNGGTVIPLRSSLPEQCYNLLPSTGGIILVKKGETGFFKTDLPDMGREENRAFVLETNEKLGVSRAQAEAMLAGSMFGWQTQAADPCSYDEQGRMKAPKQRTQKERGEAR